MKLHLEHDADYQNLELWQKELIAAGWKKLSISVWESPSGLKYRGPYAAWKMMKAHPELAVPPIKIQI